MNQSLKITTFILVTLVLSFSQLIIGQSTNLPSPAGSYLMGTSIFHLTDTSRKEIITDEPNDYRELMIQVWYPSKTEEKSNIAPYIPDERILQLMKDEKYYGLDSATIESWRKLKTNSVLDAPISNKQKKFPLLLFSHGLGISRINYTMFAEELASFGFIVVTIDHPFSGVTVLPDGRLLSISADKRRKNWSPEVAAQVVEDFANDALYILNQLIKGKFAKQMDTKRIGMIGHSIGGASALEVCRIDSRFKACANLDGAPFGVIAKQGVTKPTLVLRSNPVFTDEDLAKRGQTREQSEKFVKDRNAIYDQLLPKQKNAPTYIVRINGAGHLSFSDTPFFKDVPPPLGGKFIEGSRSFLIASDYVRGFFDKYLNGQEKGILDKVESSYPKVTVEKYGF